MYGHADHSAWVTYWKSVDTAVRANPVVGAGTEDPRQRRPGDVLPLYFLLQVISSMASERTSASTVAAKEMPIAVHGS